MSKHTTSAKLRPVTDLAPLYLDAHRRVSSLVSELESDTVHTPVPACPGWSVADVVAHLTAVAEDALAGRLTRPPSDAETAAQVSRFAGRSIGEVLAVWSALAKPFAVAVAAVGSWPAVMDVGAHEQDIRGAIGAPGARDCELVRVGADRLLSLLRLPVPMIVEVEDATFPVGDTDSGDPVRLNTTRFEAFRFRLGRRSRQQMARMAWSGDPEPVLDHLVVFGPAPRDVVE